MGIKGLCHPGVEMVDQMRDSGKDHATIHTILVKNHNHLHDALSSLQPEELTPGQIFELHTLEIALAYNEIDDLGNPELLKKLDYARKGHSPQGDPLASTFHKRAHQTALTSQQCGLVATGVKTKFE